MALRRAFGSVSTILSGQRGLRRNRPLIMDGAMGTELAFRGATEMGTAGWTVRPHFSEDGVAAIKEVHRSYLEAGADIISTHTYNLCDTYLENVMGVDVAADRLEAMQRRAVSIALEAAAEHGPVGGGGGGTNAAVAAVMGPYGAAAESGADYDFDCTAVDTETLVGFHARRASVLAAAGPSLLLFETISGRVEMDAIAAALDAIGPLAPPVWVSFAYGATGSGATACGESWAETVAAADACDRVEAIGVNCTEFSAAEEALHTAQGLTDKPLVVYPDNGTWDKAACEWRPKENEGFVAWGERLAQTAVAVGGCCCSGPSHIAALSEKLRQSTDADSSSRGGS